MLSRFHDAADKAKKVLFGGRNAIRDTHNSVISGLVRSFSSMVEQKQVPPSKVQALYDLCKKTFSSSQPSPLLPVAVQSVCSLLDSFSPADVGLQEDSLDDDLGLGYFGFQQFRSAGWPKPITYIDIYEGDDFTICIFCFPSSSVIPLHDHPSMTVFSKVLYGSLHLKGYDWVDPPRIQQSEGRDYPQVRLAKLAVDKVLTAPCGTSVLYPKSGGNLHCFTAVTPCAVIDVLAPPYSEDLGRRCTYYNDYPYISSPHESELNNENAEDYAWLGNIDVPNDFYMRPGMYRGPSLRF